MLCLCFSTQFGKNHSIFHPKNFCTCKNFFSIPSIRDSYGFSLIVIIPYFYTFKRLIASVSSALVTNYICHVILSFLQTLTAGKRNRGISPLSVFRTPGITCFVIWITPVFNRLFIYHLCRALILHNQYTELVECLRRCNARNRTA